MPPNMFGRPPENVDAALQGISELNFPPAPAVASHYDLGYFDLEQKTLQPLDNPFGPRLSPM